MKRFLSSLLFLGLFMAMGSASVKSLTVPPLKYAEKIKMKALGAGVLVTITEPWANAKESFVSLLLPHGAPLPVDHGASQVIRVPVKKVVAQSTTSIGLMVALQAEDQIVGVSDGQRINSASVHAAYQKGAIKEVGMRGRLNLEVLIQMNPDIVLSYGTGNPKYDAAQSLDRAKIPYLLLASYMEVSALARTEWIQLFGLLLGKEREAAAHMELVVREYKNTMALVPSQRVKPKVFCNIPFGGIWYMPSGDSWKAKLFKDAGADYLWADELSSGSHRLSPEQVFSKALQADIWLDPSHSQSMSTADLIALDSRYGRFKAVKNKKVYCSTKRMNEHGGNDIYELGIARPDLLLRDLVFGLYPDVKADAESVFYQWLP